MAQIEQDMLREVTRRIVSAVHPEKIVLFGSYAWGQPNDDSDVDILVVVEHSDQPAYRRATEIYRCLRGLRVPVEIVVRTREELDRGLAVKVSLERKVMEQGRVLHG